MRLVRFGALDLAEDDGSDMFVLAGRSRLLDLPNGAFDADGAAYVGEPRTFTREFSLTDAPGAAIQAQLDAFLAEVAKGRRLLVAETRGGERRQTWAKAREVMLSYAPGDLGRQRLAVTFEVDYPFWLLSADEPWLLDHGGLLDDGLTLDDGQAVVETVSSSPHGFSIVNDGGMAVERGTISLVPGAGASLTDPALYNQSTGHRLAYSGTLAAGDELLLDFLTRSARLNGSGVFASLLAAGPDSAWMQLKPGANSLRLTADAVTGTTTLRWRWSRHYL